MWFWVIKNNLLFANMNNYKSNTICQKRFWALQLPHPCSCLRLMFGIFLSFSKYSTSSYNPTNQPQSKSCLTIKLEFICFSDCLSQAKVVETTLSPKYQVQTVVCLRGGERGTCLGPPIFWGPPWGVTLINFPYFWWKTYYPLKHCAAKQIKSKYSFKGTPSETVTCRYFAFKEVPKNNCNLKVICLHRALNSHWNV